MTDILIDDEQFDSTAKNIYDAIDTDNQGTLNCVEVEKFTRGFLKGHQVEGQTNTDFSTYHEDVFKILKDNEQGEITMEEF